MRRITFASIIIAATVIAAAPAWAQNLPPGSAGVDQYTEGVPGPGGDKPSSNPGEENGNLPPGVTEELEAQGADGAATAAVAEATSPGSNKQVERADDPTSGDESGGAFSNIISALGGSDSGGMGVFLPVLLIATLVVAIALGAARLRRRGQPDSV